MSSCASRIVSSVDGFYVMGCFQLYAMGASNRSLKALSAIYMLSWSEPLPVRSKADLYRPSTVRQNPLRICFFPPSPGERSWRKFYCACFWKETLRLSFICIGAWLNLKRKGRVSVHRERLIGWAYQRYFQGPTKIILDCDRR